MTSDEKRPGIRLSTAHSRELEEELRRARARARMTTQKVAHALGWSTGKVSKLEGGSRGTDTADIAVVLGLYVADADTRARIIGLSREGGTRNFVRLHHSNPDSLATLVAHERIVQSSTTYGPVIIPALAQTPGYTRALTDDAAAVDARLARQQRVRARNAVNTFYIHQTALRTVVGGDAIMRQQLLHLAQMCSWHWHTVRVIPSTTNVGTTLRTPVTLLTFAEPDNPVVYVETDAATVFHDDPDVVAAYQARLARISHLALNAQKSQELILRMAEHYDRTADTA